MATVTLRKSPQILQTSIEEKTSTYYKGEPSLVLELVKSLKQSGQLTFHITPEGSVGAIVFTTSSYSPHSLHSTNSSSSSNKD